MYDALDALAGVSMGAYTLVEAEYIEVNATRV